MPVEAYLGGGPSRLLGGRSAEHVEAVYRLLASA
ncbi:hypothetical protein BH18ACT13_BH18ACT13_04160 [soil metagenome]